MEWREGRDAATTTPRHPPVQPHQSLRPKPELVWHLPKSNWIQFIIVLTKHALDLHWEHPSHCPVQVSALLSTSGTCTLLWLHLEPSMVCQNFQGPIRSSIDPNNELQANWVLLSPGQRQKDKVCLALELCLCNLNIWVLQASPAESLMSWESLRVPSKACGCSSLMKPCPWTHKNP